MSIFLLFAGCTVIRGERTLSQYYADATLTAKVHHKLLQSDEISVSRVHVETDKGVVLLSGFVKTAAQKQAATRIARQVKGVKGIKNNLVTYQEVEQSRRHAKALS